MQRSILPFFGTANSMRSTAYLLLKRGFWITAEHTNSNRSYTVLEPHNFYPDRPPGITVYSAHVHWYFATKTDRAMSLRTGLAKLRAFRPLVAPNMLSELGAMAIIQYWL
jgi:hypothetical protein